MMRVGIIGAGKIAGTMAEAINGLKDQGVIAYAIASRSLAKAVAFRDQHQFLKAYGSYEEMIADPLVDLVYIATPHIFHFEQAKACLLQRKPVLVEKPFTINTKQAKELFDLTERQKTFISEALWTRYQPSRFLLNKLIDSGTIGEVKQLYADFSYPLLANERLVKKELAGGALLDLGIYPLALAYTVFKTKAVAIQGKCTYLSSGVDANDCIFLDYGQTKTAVLSSSLQASSLKSAIVSGTKGYIVIKHITNPQAIMVYDQSDQMIQSVKIPEQINGYEYELLACQRALSAGCLECGEHSHADTLYLLGHMDELRRQWQITYPGE